MQSVGGSLHPGAGTAGFVGRGRVSDSSFGRRDIRGGPAETGRPQSSWKEL
jgi:hypothetical protein